MAQTFDAEQHGEPLTPAEASDRLAERHKIFLGVQRLADLRSYGGGPKFFKASHRAVRYPAHLLDEWANAKNRQLLQDCTPVARKACGANAIHS